MSNSVIYVVIAKPDVIVKISTCQTESGEDAEN